MEQVRNKIIHISLALLVCSTLSACGGGNSGTSQSVSSTPSSVVSPPVVIKAAELKPDTDPDPALPSRNSPAWDKAVDASRFLARASFGATAKDIDFIVKNGKEAWLDHQFSLAQTSQIKFLDKRLETYGMVPIPDAMYVGDVFERVMYQHNIWMETSIWGKDQLRSRVASALGQILVVSNFGANQFARERGFANYIDILGRGAFGNYGDLLKEVTLNPIMGLYLNTLNNPKADESKNIRPDENYAREVLQLFSIGLNELNIDGTEKTDGNGNKIPTFNQTTIKEFSRVFTGWSYSTYDIFAQGGVFTIYPAPISNVEPLKAFPEYHDDAVKTLLNGEVIPAGQTAMQDINSAMKNIMVHENVGPFICKKLIQYLVTSNPSNAYVTRVASIFNDNGSGIKGDMKAVVKAIYLDNESINPPLESKTYFGKRKETPLALSGVWRAFRAQGVPIKGPSTGVAITMAHNHYDGEEQEMLRASTVFNFYQSDFSPSGLLASKKLLAPEFQVFNETLAVYQTNLMFNIIFNRGIGDKNIYSGNAAREEGGFVLTGDLYDPVVKGLLNLTEEVALASTPKELVDRVNLLLTHGDISVEDTDLIVKHISLLTDPLSRVYETIFLIAISPEYAIQG